MTKKVKGDDIVQKQKQNDESSFEHLEKKFHENSREECCYNI